MGALRKPAPETLQPTQIIIFPVEQVRSRDEDEQSRWARFSESPVGSLILFEIKMLVTTAVILTLCGVLGLVAYTGKTAAGIDLFPDASLSGFPDYAHSTGYNSATIHQQF